MLDIGWSELLVIGVVALIVVGPKDLPMMFRTLGRVTGRARAMAREFTQAMDRAADEAGVKEMRDDFRKISDPRKMGLDAFDDATSDFRNLERDMKAGDAKRGKAGDGKGGKAGAGNADVAATPGSTPRRQDGPETAKLRAEKAEAQAKRMTTAADFAEAKAARAAAAPTDATEAAANAAAAGPATAPAPASTATPNATPHD